MRITSIKKLNVEGTLLLVNGVHSVPWPCNTEHRDLIQKWLGEGNTINPYVPLPPLTQRQVDLMTLRNAAVKDAIVVLCGLIDGLIDKGVISAADVDQPTRDAYRTLKPIADRVKS